MFLFGVSREESSPTHFAHCLCRCGLDQDRRVDSLEPTGAAAKHSVGLGDQARVFAVPMTREITLASN